MALKETEVTLQAALQVTGIVGLPKAIDADYKGTWIKAICLVTKVTGRQNYVLADNDGNGNAVIKRDFGSSATIARIDSIHPYEELDERFTPNLRGDEAKATFLAKKGYDAEEIANLQSTEGKSKEQIKADKETVKSYIDRVAVGMAKETLAEEARCQEIIEKSKRRRNGKQSKSTKED